ncbi:MAG TPA: hypothetical protein PLP19_05265 [bacterium]|nr:hypothetical protein [bacterium]HPN42880.1 hypothetical protein [bacterium]
MKKKSKGYSVLELGFANVRVVCHPVFHPLPAEMQQNIELYWNRIRNRKHLFNGLLLRLDSWSVDANTLLLNTSITDYRTLMYTNSHARLIAENWGINCFARALGISALVVCRDQFMVLMRRSNQVGEYRNCIDVFGGHVGMDEKSINLDIRQAMFKELEEELGLLPDDVNLTSSGLIQCNAHSKPELLFTASTSLSVREIIDKSNRARDRFEYTSIVIIPADDCTLAGFLRVNTRLTSPSAYGSLELFIQQKYI